MAPDVLQAARMRLWPMRNCVYAGMDRHVCFTNQFTSTCLANTRLNKKSTCLQTYNYECLGSVIRSEMSY